VGGSDAGSWRDIHGVAVGVGLCTYHLECVIPAQAGINGRHFDARPASTLSDQSIGTPKRKNTLQKTTIASARRHQQEFRKKLFLLISFYF
jgi:hypothetical protein